MGSRRTLLLMAMLACLDGSGCTNGQSGCASGQGVPPEPVCRAQQYPYGGCELPLDCDKELCPSYDEAVSLVNCLSGSSLREGTCGGFRVIDSRGFGFGTRWFFMEDSGEPVGVELFQDYALCCERFAPDESGCNVCVEEGVTVVLGKTSDCVLADLAPVCFDGTVDDVGGSFDDAGSP